MPAITPPAESDITVAVAETLATIDTLIDRGVRLSQDAARLRLALEDLRAEQKLREAMVALSIEGKNTDERAARLRLQLAADGDVRRLMEAEKDARLKLAEVEAELWATRMKARACLTLLRLAAGQTEGEEGEVGQAEAEGEAP
jgi:hypothetical protein